MWATRSMNDLGTRPELWDSIYDMMMMTIWHPKLMLSEGTEGDIRDRSSLSVPGTTAIPTRTTPRFLGIRIFQVHVQLQLTLCPGEILH
jgi:hypothetical protein